MRNKAVGDVKYTSLRDVHMLDYDSTFDQDTVNYVREFRTLSLSKTVKWN